MITIIYNYKPRFEHYKAVGRSTFGSRFFSLFLHLPARSRYATRSVSRSEASAKAGAALSGYLALSQLYRTVRQELSKERVI